MLKVEEMIASGILYIYEQLTNDHIVVSADVVTKFNVRNRTVQKDIDEVKDFCGNCSW